MQLNVSIGHAEIDLRVISIVKIDRLHNHLQVAANWFCDIGTDQGHIHPSAVRGHVPTGGEVTGGDMGCQIDSALLVEA